MLNSNSTVVNYFTLEGEQIHHKVSGFVSLVDIDRVCFLYSDKTGRQPERIYLRKDLFIHLMQDLAAGYSSSFYNGLTKVQLYLGMGALDVVSVDYLEIPFVVGNEAEYMETLLGKIFEETILNG